MLTCCKVLGCFIWLNLDVTTARLKVWCLSGLADHIGWSGWQGLGLELGLGVNLSLRSICSDNRSRLECLRSRSLPLHSGYECYPKVDSYYVTEENMYKSPLQGMKRGKWGRCHRKHFKSMAEVDVIEKATIQGLLQVSHLCLTH